MKTIKWICSGLLAVICAVAFTSCNKETVYSESDVIGSWDGTPQKTTGIDSVILILNSNKTGSVEVTYTDAESSTSRMPFSWTLSSNVITMTYNVNDADDLGNKLIIKSIGNGVMSAEFSGGMSVTFTKLFAK